jgi:hypothetical protein
MTKNHLVAQLFSMFTLSRVCTRCGAPGSGKRRLSRPRVGHYARCLICVAPQMPVSDVGNSLENHPLR